jgi:hypothetical protein
VISVFGAPISWKSKSSKNVTLSSTELEYFSASETARELYACSWFNLRNGIVE